MSRGKKIVLWIIGAAGGLLGLFGLGVLIAMALGCRIVISDADTPNWEAVGAIASCIGSCLIPIAVVFLQSAITKNTERADALVLELANFKAEYGEDIKAWAAWNRGETTVVLDGGGSDACS